MKTKTVYGMWIAGLIILSGCQLTDPPSPAMQESARPAPIVQETAKPVALAPSSVNRRSRAAEPDEGANGKISAAFRGFQPNPRKEYAVV